MEVPDIEAYVHPGEVLLTTLYPLRDDLAGVADLVRRLHAATLSALVVRVGRYVDHIPATALEAADELGFPIIVVDTHIGFNDVISAVLAIVLADYGPEPGRAETIRERLTAVALTGGGLAEIARTLAGALDRHVAVVDAGGATLGTGRPPAGPAGAVLPVADHSWTFPITVAGTERGRLLVDGNTEPTLGQRRLIRQACFAAGTAMPAGSVGGRPMPSVAPPASTTVTWRSSAPARVRAISARPPPVRATAVSRSRMVSARPGSGP